MQPVQALKQTAVRLYDPADMMVLEISEADRHEAKSLGQDL